MIYLDNAATSYPKPEAVYAAMDRCARTQLANPGRAGHKMALESERLLDDARHRLNQFVPPRKVLQAKAATDSSGLLNVCGEDVPVVPPEPDPAVSRPAGVRP